eukprot:TRINITY_DN6878_c0_g1_i1.p1 TRINITY_DN6878_c0_g1~~TRINITY_DN6878_c0_g1_i1.p1  ORF type:complete len:303 (+),score=53.54 TRINITY_DN6878_c0_g1_i1:49-909(+)
METTKVSHLERVNLKGTKGKLWQVDHFLSYRECAALLQRAETAGWRPSPPSGGGHGRTGREYPRTSAVSIVVDQAVAQQWYDRIKPFVPEDISWLRGNPNVPQDPTAPQWRPVGVVERLRLYRYEKGDEYPEHRDGCYKRNFVNADGGTIQQRTFLTLLIYLNDECEGGETVFYANNEHCQFLRASENKPVSVSVTPELGRALVSKHNILHKGSVVTRGVKYVARTDIVYQRTLPLHPKLSKHNKATNNSTNSSSSNTNGSASVPSNISQVEWEKEFEPSCKAYHD